MATTEQPNPPDDDKQDFFERVWDVVAQIPPGKVTTYGDIAEYLGTRSAARSVGWALNAAVGSGLPCHRVVNRFGALTGKRHFEGPHVMEERLRSEGVTFTPEGHVQLDEHRWIPGVRPDADEPTDGLTSDDGPGVSGRKR